MDYKELMKSVGVQSCVTHSCPRCQSPVRCDISLGKNDCWCFSVQSKGLDMNDVCMCKTCLKNA
jgi:hypothetical protein